MTPQKLVVQDLYNFLLEVNPQGAADLNTEDTVWKFPGDPTRAPFSGIWEGQQGVLDWYASLAATQLSDFSRLEYLENGDKVAVRIREIGQSTFAQVPYQAELTQLWTFNDHRMSGGAGDDTFFLGSGDRALGGGGNDTFYVQTGGDNLLAGGSGADVFRIANAEIPDSANTITDFELGVDSIVVAGIGASSIGDLTFTQMDNHTMIAFGGNDLATLLNTQSTQLESSGLFEFS